jgi:hypothetical protein
MGIKKGALRPNIHGIAKRAPNQPGHHFTQGGNVVFGLLDIFGR